VLSNSFELRIVNIEWLDNLLSYLLTMVNIHGDIQASFLRELRWRTLMEE